MNLSRPVRYTFALIGLAVCIVAIYLATLLIKGDLKLKDVINNFVDLTKDEASQEGTYTKQTESGEVKLSDKYFEDPKNVRFEVLKEESSDIGKTSNVQDLEQKKQLSKLLNREPQLSMITYMPSGEFSVPGMFVNQGDYVNVNNESLQTIVLLAKSLSEETKIEIPPGEVRTFGFDFIGEFVYEVESNKKSFTVVVANLEDE